MRITTQGYWIPFEAAKAIATKLCYDIRYVLVPLFGPDFITMCHHREDPEFNSLLVDRDVIQRCTSAVAAMFNRSRESSLSGSIRTPSPHTTVALGPVAKGLQSGSLGLIDIESGYGTDTDRSVRYPEYPGSPGSGSSMAWTPVNTPRIGRPNKSQLLSPSQGSDSIGSGPRLKKRPLREEVPSQDASSHSTRPKSMALPAVKRTKLIPPRANIENSELEAAYALIGLSRADTIVTEE